MSWSGWPSGTGWWVLAALHDFRVDPAHWAAHELGRTGPMGSWYRDRARAGGGVPFDLGTPTSTLDLKNEFYDRVAQKGAVPDVGFRLRVTIAAPKKTIANKNAELDQACADVPALVRVVNQLTLENQQLRAALTHREHNVVSVRPRDEHRT